VTTPVPAAVATPAAPVRAAPAAASAASAPAASSFDLFNDDAIGVFISGGSRDAGCARRVRRMTTALRARGFVITHEAGSGDGGDGTVLDYSDGVDASDAASQESGIGAALMASGAVVLCLTREYIAKLASHQKKVTSTGRNFERALRMHKPRRMVPVCIEADGTANTDWPPLMSIPLGPIPPIQLCDDGEEPFGRGLAALFKRLGDILPSQAMPDDPSADAADGAAAGTAVAPLEFSRRPRPLRCLEGVLPTW